MAIKSFACYNWLSFKGSAFRIPRVGKFSFDRFYSRCARNKINSITLIDFGDLRPTFMSIVTLKHMMDIPEETI